MDRGIKTLPWRSHIRRSHPRSLSERSALRVMLATLAVAIGMVVQSSTAVRPLSRVEAAAPPDQTITSALRPYLIHLAPPNSIVLADAPLSDLTVQAQN